MTGLSFSPPWEPWTPFSFLGTPDFLSTYLRIDSLKNMEIVKGSVIAKGLVDRECEWRIVSMQEGGETTLQDTIMIHHLNP